MVVETSKIKYKVYGYWSAVAATVLSILFAVLALSFTPEEWQNIGEYARTFKSVQMLSFIPVFLLPIAMVVLMASIYFYASVDKKYFGILGISFVVAYMVVICINYYLQLFVVRLNLLSGQTEGLALFAMPNLHSIFFALETVGYFFLCLSTFFAAFIFEGGKLEKWIKWLFIINGLIGFTGIIIVPLDKPMIIFASIGVWCITFPLSTALLGVLFKRECA